MIGKRTVILLCCMVMTAATFVQGRSILEKTLYYVSEGKVGSCKFWTMHLGTHACTLTRKFPGEDTLALSANMNLSLVSSGFIEGHGFSEKGKVDCAADFRLDKDGSGGIVPVDSIDYVSHNGNNIRKNSGESGNLLLDVEGSRIRIERLVLWMFKLGTEYDEEVLKKDREIVISAFSFSKDGIQRALNAMKTE